MSDLKKSHRSLRILLSLGVGIAALFAISESPLAQVSEIDSYDRAVTSQTKEDALAFIEEFRSSHLVGDLIESLRPAVAREVCADLPSGVSRARRACEQLRRAPVAAETAVSSGDDATSTTQSSAAAAPTQPIETQPIAGVAPAPATTGAIAAAPATPPQIVVPPASGQSQIGASSTTAAVASRATVPATMAAAGSAPPSSGLPEPAATAPPTPIKSKPTVYVRSDSGADIHAQAADGSAILGTASRNASLTVLSRDRNWLKVLVPGTAARAGWVHTSMLQSDASGIKVDPATKTATATASASTMPAPAAQVATKMAPAAATTVPPAATGTITATAPATATAGSAAATQAGAASAFRIQLLSSKSRADAENGWRHLQSAYPDLLGNLEFSIAEVNLGAAKGGVWHRGFAGPIASRDEANVLCIIIRSRPPHNDCFVAGY